MTPVHCVPPVHLVAMNQSKTVLIVGMIVWRPHPAQTSFPTFSDLKA